MGTRTLITTSDPMAVKKYSATLAKEVHDKSYFSRFIAPVRGVNDDPAAPIWMYTDLDASQGDQIRFDLVKALQGAPTTGDNMLLPNAERLIFYTDTLNVDQLRHAVDTGGNMTKKRTVHDLRDLARNRLSDYFAQLFDEMLFYYLAGSRGTDTTGRVLPTSWTGHAGNPLSSPDSGHWVFGGDATSEATIDSSDKMDLSAIDRAVLVAKTAWPRIQPVRVEGNDYYVCVMSPEQANNLKNASGSKWLDIQKAAAAAVGFNSPIFKGGIGIYNGVVLHEHPNVCKLGVGSGGSVSGARAVLMGKQAGVIAFGIKGTGLRYSWSEELIDLGNILVVAAGTIVGVKKTVFNSADFGVVTISTAI